MTTVRATMKGGQIILQGAERLGLREGESVHLAPIEGNAREDTEFVSEAEQRERELARRLGLAEDDPLIQMAEYFGPLPDGYDAVSWVREMRDGDES